MSGQDFGRRAAKAAGAAAPGRPDVVTLWEFPSSDWPEWMTRGWGDCALSEYRQRLAGAKAEFERQGLRVVIVTATVKELADTLADCELEDTPDGRAAGIAFLHARRGL